MTYSTSKWLQNKLLRTENAEKSTRYFNVMTCENQPEGEKCHLRAHQKCDISRNLGYTNIIIKDKELKRKYAGHSLNKLDTCLKITKTERSKNYLRALEKKVKLICILSRLHT